MRRSLRDTASTALYEAVKNHIRGRIASGEWKTGDRIASEHELVALLGVSRMTVHRALRELAAQGLLLRHAGVGTFVAEEKPQSGLLRVASMAAEIRARGHEHAFELLQSGRLSASLEVASALGLATGESVFHTLGLHLENGVPVQLEDRYVNPRSAPAFLDQDFTVTPPGEYLRLHVPLDELEHVVDAVSAAPDVAQRLQIRPGDPCLVLTRRTWAGGVPVTFVRCTHPGSRYRLGARFPVEGNPGVG